MSFSGKNYLIIGATSGIGHRLAEILIADGANVFTASRKGAEGVPPGAKATIIDSTADFTLPEGFLPETLHGLAYCAGSITLKPANRVSPADLLQDYNINVVGAYRCILASLKGLKASGSGSIVLFSTVAAKLGMGFHASIASAKGGVEALAKSLAAELAPQKIRVNVVAPSLTDTPLAGSLLSTPEKREASDKRHPLGRVGTPDDVAQAAAFLLGSNASWITGQILGVDGGMGSTK